MNGENPRQDSPMIEGLSHFGKMQAKSQLDGQFDADQSPIEIKNRRQASHGAQVQLKSVDVANNQKLNSPPSNIMSSRIADLLINTNIGEENTAVKFKSDSGSVMSPKTPMTVLPLYNEGDESPIIDPKKS